MAVPQGASAANGGWKTVTFTAPFTGGTSLSLSGCDDSTATCNAEPSASDEGILAGTAAVSRTVPVPQATWNPTDAFTSGHYVEQLTVPRSASTVTFSLVGTLEATGCEVHATRGIASAASELMIVVVDADDSVRRVESVNPSYCDNRNLAGSPYAFHTPLGALTLTTDSLEVQDQRGAQLTVFAALRMAGRMYDSTTRPAGSAAVSATYRVSSIVATFD